MQKRDLVNLKPRTKSKQSSNQQTDVEQLMKRVCDKLDEGGVKGAVRLASSNNGVLEPSEEILSKLREKIPPRPLDRLVFPEDECPPFQASEIRVLMALKFFFLVGYLA